MKTERHASADEVIRELRAGNSRFLHNKSTRKHSDVQRVKDTAESRSPRAIILTCSDSRISPEIIFDLGIGDLYVIRNAGNITDPVVIGTIEYAVVSQQAPGIVVLGHTRCGAIKAALAGEYMSGCIGEIITRVQPSVKTAAQEDKKLTGDDRITQVVKLNVLNSILCIIKDSAVIRDAVDKKTITIIGAVYDVNDGSVIWL